MTLYEEGRRLREAIDEAVKVTKELIVRDYRIAKAVIRTVIFKLRKKKNA